MTDSRRATGAWGEDQAARELVRRGLRILGRNVLTPSGEIDIVALAPGGILCFVEVRTLRESSTHHPLDSVGPQKRARIIRAAMEYLRQHRIVRTLVRFDLVAVSVQQGQTQIHHLPNAFTPDESGGL